MREKGTSWAGTSHRPRDIETYRQTYKLNCTPLGSSGPQCGDNKLSAEMWRFKKPHFGAASVISTCIKFPFVGLISKYNILKLD